MLVYMVLAFGGIFTLIAIAINEDNKLNDFLISIVVFAVFVALVRISNAIRYFNDYSATPTNIAIMIAVAAYVIYMFRKNDPRWNG